MTALRPPTERSPAAPGTAAAVAPREVLQGRWFAIGLLFGIEAAIAIGAYTTPPAMVRALGWTYPLLNRQTLFGAPLLGLVTFLLLIRPTARAHWQRLQAAVAAPRGAAPWLWQVASCLLCFAAAWPLYARTATLGATGWFWLMLWLAGLAGCFVGSLHLLAPLRFWRTLLREERGSAWRAGIAMLAAAGLIAGLFEAWTALPWLATVTLEASAALLRPHYPNLVVEPAQALLAVGEFSVIVSDACSGYLGVSLTLAVLAAYGWLFRDLLPRWAPLVLLLAGIAISLSLNATRIAVLVAIGVEWSPQIAERGFHTHAGSLAMVAGSGLIIASVHALLVLPAERRRAAQGADPAAPAFVTEAALLLPMLVLLASMLITGALSGDFQWLYPLRVLATGSVLVWLWPRILLPAAGRPALAVAAGIAVGLLWLALVEADPLADARDAVELASVGVWPSTAWVLTRALGTVLIVPLAEELAFRGWLLPLLSRQPIDPARPLAPDVLGILGSSLLFGGLHGDWLAGTLAGIVFAAVRLRAGTLRDAVIAHAVANLLITARVLGTGEWSYW